MDFVAVLWTVLRRWPVVLVVLAVTAVAAYQVSRAVEAEYEATGSVLLTGRAGGESAAAEGGADDSWPADNLDSVVLAELTESGTVRDRLRADGATASYDVAAQSDGNLLRVTATGDNRNAVVRTVLAVLDALDEELVARQETLGVREDMRSSIEVLSRPTRAEPAPGQTSGFVAEGSAQLEGPTAESPYQSPSFTTDILKRIATSPQMAETLADRGVKSTYTVRSNRDDTAPILYIDVIGPDGDNVVETFREVTDALNTVLRERQLQAGPIYWSALRPLATPTTSGSSGDEYLRPVITVGALGIAAAVALALLFDNLQAARVRRRPTRYSTDAPRSALAPTGSTSSARAGGVPKTRSAGEAGAQPRQTSSRRGAR